MASPRPWPFDDEDRPSGSVQPLSQADLHAILAHLSDDPDELLAGTDADRPVVAVRVRTSVGRPGGSAHAQWRRMRAAEWAAWIRSLPWRVAATLGTAAVGAVLGSLLAARLALVLGALAAVAAGWALRFRPSPDAIAWRQGAAGEQRTARLLAGLERQGWVVLHDLAIPGSRANIDHLVIGPGGGQGGEREEQVLGESWSSPGRESAGAQWAVVQGHSTPRLPAPASPRPGERRPHEGGR